MGWGLTFLAWNFRMADEQFQKCLFLKINFGLPDWKEFGNSLINQFRLFWKFAISKN